MTISIAAAQAPSVPGDLDANLRIHLAFIAAARAAGVEVLVFPELSLSGYELPLLQGCALTPNDVRLAAIGDAAMAAGMTVIAGAPVRAAGLGDKANADTDADTDAALPGIGAIVFGADGGRAVYRKQYLHAGEDRYVRAGAIGAHVLDLHGHRCALAICADTTHHAHAQAAAEAHATLYLAGVLITEGGYANDAAMLRQYATEFKMGVLLANHAAPSGGYQVAGRSAFWTPDGALLAQVEGPGDFLLIARQLQHEGWQAEVLPVTC